MFEDPISLVELAELAINEVALITFFSFYLSSICWIYRGCTSHRERWREDPIVWLEQRLRESAPMRCPYHICQSPHLQWSYRGIDPTWPLQADLTTPNLFSSLQPSPRHLICVHQTPQYPQLSVFFPFFVFFDHTTFQDVCASEPAFGRDKGKRGNC